MNTFLLFYARINPGVGIMNAVGIICEYNPFHNGHIYHIEKVKEMFPNSILVLVLNGYFLERGEVSYLSKEDKTKLALTYGCDLVISLPVVFGTQSADIFAERSIEILQKLHVSDLVFGSECNDIEQILKMAKIQLTEDYSSRLKEILDTGVNYPTALSKAMNLDVIIDQPNDLLGISYAKAILKHQYPITLHTIQRTNHYHDILDTQNIVSASNIRHKLLNQEDISHFVPLEVPSLLHIPNLDLFFQLLKYRIITDTHLEEYETVDEGIEARLKKEIWKSSNLEEFIKLIKTKRYTYNRIQRMFFHILLGFTKKDNKKLVFDYIQILGFSWQGQQYLNSIKDGLEISTRINPSSLLYEFEKRATFLYEILTNSSVQTFEFRNKPIIKTDLSLFDK